MGRPFSATTTELMGGLSCNRRLTSCTTSELSTVVQSEASSPHRGGALPLAAQGLLVAGLERDVHCGLGLGKGRRGQIIPLSGVHAHGHQRRQGQLGLHAFGHHLGSGFFGQQHQGLDHDPLERVALDVADEADVALDVVGSKAGQEHQVGVAPRRCRRWR